ncbi:MAG TPA: hypothetical protein VFD23_07010 [Clostridia bacterium]|nr:hypothetical protein [Clostridia bacterium]
MKYVFRAVSAILALCVLPAAYFLSFIQFVFSAVIANIGDDFSIKEIFEQFFDKSSPLYGLLDNSSQLLANASVKVLMPAGITFLSFFALALVVSFVIFFFALFSNKRLVITGLGGVGFLSVIGMYIAFGRFATPLLDGTIQVNDFLNVGTLGFLINSVVKIELFKLTSAPLIMAVIFALIVIWGLAFIITEDESEKKQRRLEKAAKKQ